ncbi:hypothetical protein MNKW57_05490 [Biformimicrobium ophioploci]|uniref:Uncharacterized protein n=2 Tax=Biformimicrobium ophioploci TaxID=3036711 RepID=A0ABQ6LVW7_9GAMM|nr:hypothetical protein MNKW57_05490 [Microbulbifer sp. NKW57]
MHPRYRDDDYVLALRHRWQSFGPGDVVVLEHPQLGRLLKRIVRCTGAGEFEVAGDNVAESTAAGVIGPVSLSAIIGRVGCWGQSRSSDPEGRIGA